MTAVADPVTAQVDETPALGAAGLSRAAGNARSDRQELEEGTLLLEPHGAKLDASLNVEGTEEPKLVHKTPFRIGRGPDCELVLDDPTVSRRHAQIELVSGVYCLQDLDSSNGISVNGHGVSRTLLVSGDRIELGNVRLVFSLETRAPAGVKFPVQGKRTGFRLLLVIGTVAAVLLTAFGVYGFSPLMDLWSSSTPVGDVAASAAEEPTTAPAPGTSVASPKRTEPVAGAAAPVADGDADSEKATAGPGSPADFERTIDAKSDVIGNRSGRKAVQPKTRKPPAVDESAGSNDTDRVRKPRVGVSDHATSVMAEARAAYLDGRGEAALDILRGLRASGDAGTDRSVEAIRERIETLLTLHRRAETAFRNGDRDGAFRQWSGFLAAEQKLFQDRRSTYAQSVMAQVVGEYHRLGEQAEGESRFHDAYRMWQRAALLDPAGTSAVALRKLQARARKLFREGYRLETAELARARERWERVLELVPPADEYHIKAKAKLAWYQRYGR